MVAETNVRAMARRDEPVRDIDSIDLTAIERVVVAGDLSKLTAEERWDYYRGVCQSVGLNPYTKPFEYVVLNGKMVLYANKNAGEQLRRIYGISIPQPQTQLQDGLCIVTVTGTDARGRTDSEIGAVVLPAGGEARANALMKALTKAKRRLTLSMCGLGMLDETEVETIPNATRPTFDTLPQGALPDADQQEQGEVYDLPLTCKDCQGHIKGARFQDGSILEPKDVASRSQERYGRALCMPCSRKAAKAEREQQAQAGAYLMQDAEAAQ